MRASVGRAVAAALAILLLAPAAAQAHGLVTRTNLPIPQWMFGWAATLVLVVSFVGLAVLWPKPKLQSPSWRPLPGGAIIGGRVVQTLAALAGVALLALVISAGYGGGRSAFDNLAPTVILILFWVGMPMLSAIFGDVFYAISPWRAFRFPGIRSYPERWGRWPAAAALFSFTWVELVSSWGETPSTLVTIGLAYTVYTFVMQFVFGTEQWTKRGEGFAVYFNMCSRIAPFETRLGVVGLRPPLGGLPGLEVVPGTIAFVLVMIGTVTFDGLSNGPIWSEISVWLARVLDGLLGIEQAPLAANSIGLILAVALISGFYRLGIDGAHSVGGGFDKRELAAKFIHSLIPIALAYVVAHYVTFLVFEGQATFYLIADPFALDWNLFGTANRAIDYTVMSTEAAWYTQLAAIVIGHVASLMLAHDRALTLYRDPRKAVRSQYWMLAIMVGFTSLALWLLAQSAG